MLNIVYQAYGHTDILNEAIYSLLSLVHRSGGNTLPHGLRTLIYTDNEAYFQRYLGDLKGIEYIPLPPEQVKEWKGPTDFVHRVKIMVLKDAAARYPDADILYLDTDTVFDQPLSALASQIQAAKLVMHEDEGRIGSRSNLTFRRLCKFLKSSNGAGIPIPLSTHMWNAGLLGIPHKRLYLLDEVLALTDRMHPLFPRHIVEQLAFSYVFQQTMPLTSAKAEVYHYWHFKEFRQVLAAFFQKYEGRKIQELTAAAARLHPAELRAPKTRFERVPKFIRTLTGMKWKLPRVEGLEY